VWATVNNTNHLLIEVWLKNYPLMSVLIPLPISSLRLLPTQVRLSSATVRAISV
jgi:hypothetical protein